MFKKQELKDEQEVADLASRSTQILSVFTQTQEDLRVLNQDATDVIAAREEKIRVHQAHVNQLKDSISKNTKLHDKINSFLND